MKSDKSIRRIARKARENGTKYIISPERGGMYWHLYEVRNNDAEMSGLAWLHTFNDFTTMCQWVSENKRSGIEYVDLF